MVKLATQTRNIYSAQAVILGNSREELLAALTELVDAALIAGCALPGLHLNVRMDYTATVTGRVPEEAVEVRLPDFDLMNLRERMDAEWRSVADLDVALAGCQPMFDSVEAV